MTSYDVAIAEQAERERRLTPAGWPRERRPNREGVTFPVAWITLAPDFASMDPVRGKEALEQRLCQVCGEGHDDAGDVVIFLDGLPRDAKTFDEVPIGYELGDDPGQWRREQLILLARDQAILHERCARLAVGTCPFLKKAAAGDRLFAFIGPVARVFHRTIHDRPSQVYLPGEAAKVWLMPEPS